MKKLNIVLLLLICTLNAFSQTEEATKKYEQIILDGKPVFVNIKTGEIVENNSSEIGSSTYKTTNILNLDNSSSLHLVEKGETLYSISKKYDVSIPYLKKLNPSIDVTAIKQGQQIVIVRTVETNKTKKVVEVHNSTNLSNTYIVEKGDTLYGISKKFHISINDLIKKNHLDSDIISVGKSLIIK